MTNDPEKSAENKQIISAYAALFAFGLVYDQLVDFVEEEMLDDGKTADLVVFGTFVTLLPLISLFGWRRWLIILGAFAASGLPMRFGSRWRYARRRAAETAVKHHAAK